MNTNCLYDYIGIRGCGETTPDSGLYINSLPGLPLESIDKMANADQVTYKNVYRDIQERALPKFFTAANSLLKKRFRLKTLQTTIDLTRRKDTSTVIAAAGQYRGLMIELDFNNPNYVIASNYQVIAIQTLSLYLSAVATGDIDIKIYDIDTDTILETKTLAQASQVVGWNVIQINTYYKATRLFIGYDATEVDSITNEIPGYAYNNFCGCVAQIYRNGCTPSLSGATTANLDDEMVITKGGNNLHGLTAIFSIQCNYDFLICNNKQLFAIALQYFLGAELMVERQHSPRINKWTTVDLDKAKELEQRFLTDAENLLQQAIDGIDMDLSDCCFECNSQVTIKESRM